MQYDEIAKKMGFSARNVYRYRRNAINNLEI